MVTGIQYLAVGNTTPFFVLIISAVSLKEKLTVPKIIACICVILGVSVLQVVSK
jgi:drug/metabolite transporter (DMT)-like permease